MIQSAPAGVCGVSSKDAARAHQLLRVFATKLRSRNLKRVIKLTC